MPVINTVCSAISRGGRWLLFCFDLGSTHVDQELTVRVKRTIVVKLLPLVDVVAVVPMPPIVTPDALHVKVVCRLILSLRWCHRPDQMPSAFDA